MEALTLTSYIDNRNDSPQNKLKIIHATRNGVTRSQLKKFSLRVALPLTKISEIVPASYSTLSKKLSYDKEVSERLFEIAEVYSKGFEVFGDEKKLTQWLNKKRKVLFVDDCQEIRSFFDLAFSDYYIIYLADSVENALGILEKEHIPIIVSDQKMPGKTGLELFEFLEKKETIKTIKILGI